MNLRAEVIQELEASGTLAPLGTDEDDIDRQLRQLRDGGSIDDRIARIKLEIDRPPTVHPAAALDARMLAGRLCQGWRLNGG